MATLCPEHLRLRSEALDIYARREEVSAERHAEALAWLDKLASYTEMEQSEYDKIVEHSRRFAARMQSSGIRQA